MSERTGAARDGSEQAGPDGHAPGRLRGARSPRDRDSRDGHGNRNDQDARDDRNDQDARDSRDGHDNRNSRDGQDDQDGHEPGPHGRDGHGAGPDGRAGIDAELVRHLVAEQFPQWRDLPVAPVAVDGWDNRTYRLGEHMTVRLPTAEGYVPAVAKENRWLPVLAPQLPVPVPKVLGAGVPGCGYPYPWSVRGWIDGRTVRAAGVADLVGFAEQVAEFVRALERVDVARAKAVGGPLPLAGPHSFHRGAPPAYYDAQTRAALAALEGRIDTARATRVWQAALAQEWQGPPTWFHGDIADGNLLVRDDALAAVLDFGTCGVGDPACDLLIAWTLFHGDSRARFRQSIGHDRATWARARGWALWKALIMTAQFLDADPKSAAEHLRVIDEVLTDHETAA